MRQTYEIGATYMAVPLPWWSEFCQYAGKGQYVTGVPWHEVCTFADDEGAQYDEEGNLLICLLAEGHQGGCGRPGAGRLLRTGPKEAEYGEL